MRVRTEILWVLAGLLALQLATSFAAIGLFDRVGPAIEQIVEPPNSGDGAGQPFVALWARMQARDEEARRLVVAGAWSLALLGALSVIVFIFVVRRLERRVVEPIAELDRVTDASARGERLRRCRLQDAPDELRRVTEALNRILDRQAHMASSPSSTGRTRDRALLDRRALLRLLAREPGPVAVLGSDGALLACNRPARDALDASPELRGALATDSAAATERLELGIEGAFIAWFGGVEADGDPRGQG